MLDGFIFSHFCSIKRHFFVQFLEKSFTGILTVLYTEMDMIKHKKKVIA